MTHRIYWNDDWYFAGNYEEEMKGLSFDSQRLQRVRLPHTVKETPFHYFDESIYQMDCCYRKEFRAPNDWKGKLLQLTFEGAAHSAEVFLNGVKIGEHHCGYTAFTVELQEYMIWDALNVLAVRLDTREDQNIPPFGYVVDYMTFGGLYRDVYLEVREPEHLEDVFVKTQIMAYLESEKAGARRASARLITQIQLSDAAKGCYVRQYLKPWQDTVRPELDLTEENREARLLGELCGQNEHVQTVYELPEVLLWDVEHPRLYIVLTQLIRETDGAVLDEREVRFGFRKAEFVSDGFYLNDKKIRLRGLNRHQSYPYVGYAMPAAPQRLDAEILKRELCVNAVRTSHYPQSHYFLDACDELGLLVFTEIPGWQYIGDEQWKAQAVQNVKDMVTQYRNHTSIVLWGVRINESDDDHDFYMQTNQMAHALDDTRPTGGVRALKKSELLEDVYTYNDFVHEGNNAGCQHKSAVTSKMQKSYLITEYGGHMYPNKSFDCEEHRMEHANRHANVLNAVAGEADIAGSFGWCMFDYNTHKDFGSGDRICYHGVMDMFRNPKLAAAVYAAEGEEELTDVLEVSSTMDIGEHPACNRGSTYIYTNAHSVRMYKNGKLLKEYTPQDSAWKNLKHGPILVDDYVGDALDAEHRPEWQKKDIKALMNEVSLHGMSHLRLPMLLKAVKLMLFGHLTEHDAVQMYNRYVGDWGGEATVYRFDAVKNGEVVKSVVRQPMKETFLKVTADHCKLTEGVSYDVSTIRICAVDGNGNVLPYFDEPVIFTVEGPIELIGPGQLSLKGGMGGTYVRTTGEYGRAVLYMETAGGVSARVHFTCE